MPLHPLGSLLHSPRKWFSGKCWWLRQDNAEMMTGITVCSFQPYSLEDWAGHLQTSRYKKWSESLTTVNHPELTDSIWWIDLWINIKISNCHWIYKAGQGYTDKTCFLIWLSLCHQFFKSEAGLMTLTFHTIIRTLLVRCWTRLAVLCPILDWLIKSMI